MVLCAICACNEITRDPTFCRCGFKVCHICYYSWVEQIIINQKFNENINIKCINNSCFMVAPLTTFVRKHINDYENEREQLLLEKICNLIFERYLRMTSDVRFLSRVRMQKRRYSYRRILRGKAIMQKLRLSMERI